MGRVLFEILCINNAMQHIIDVDSSSVSAFVVILVGKYSNCQLNQYNYKY